MSGRGRAWLWAGVAVVAIAVGLAVCLARPDPAGIRKRAAEGAPARRADTTAAAAVLPQLRDPTPRDRLMRAEAARGVGRTDDALTELARIPEEDSGAPRALVMAAEIDLRRDRVARGEAALQRALRRDPKLAAAHRLLIYIDGMLLRRRALDEHFRALQGLGPLTFDNIFRTGAWSATPSGSRTSGSRTFGGSWRPTRPTGRHAWRWPRPSASLAAGTRRPRYWPLSRSTTPTQQGRSRPGSRLDAGDEAAADALLAEGPLGSPRAGARHPRPARRRARGDAEAAVRHFSCAAFAAEPDDRDTVFGLGAAADDDRRLPGGRRAPLLRRSKRGADTLGALLTRAANPAARRDPAVLRALGAACEAAGRLPEARAWYDLAVGLDASDTAAQAALRRLKPQ